MSMKPQDPDGKDHQIMSNIKLLLPIGMPPLQGHHNDGEPRTPFLDKGYPRGDNPQRGGTQPGHHPPRDGGERGDPGRSKRIREY